MSLQKYLGNWGVQLAGSGDVTKVIEHLNKLDTVKLPAEANPDG